MIRLALAAFMACTLTGCESNNEIPGFNAMEKQVTRTRIGYGVDQWIEMKNGIAEWERVGLIFGYTDDYEECVKAIAGMRAANFGSEYRCVPAN